VKGLRIVERNWLDIYPYVPWNAKTIPQFRIGESFQPTLLKMNEKETVAPALLTEPELISKMDKEGIGTDATIADHIKTIQDRGYAVKRGGFFFPEPIGLALVLGYEDMGFDFAKPRLRAEMEQAMNAVSRGEKEFEEERKKFIAEYARSYERVTHMVAMLDRSFQKQMRDNPKPAAAAPPMAAAAERGAPREKGRGRGRRGRGK
jgi:DNA topoisomerase-3